MDRNQKKDWVDQLRTSLENATLIVAVSPAGLNAAEVTDFRGRVRAEGAEYKVIKNTLADISVKGMPYEGLKSFFKGPVALAYSKDPVAAARVAAKYAKDNAKFAILGGCLDGVTMDKAQVMALATLPSLDELRGKLVGLISAPATKLAILLKEPGARIARVTSAHASTACGA